MIWNALLKLSDFCLQFEIFSSACKYIAILIITYIDINRIQSNQIIT